MSTARGRRGRWTGWPSRLVREENGFGPGSLIRIMLWFAVIAIVFHDLGQLVWSQVQVADAAHRSALAAADTYYQYRVAARAEQEALETVASVNKSIELKAFKVDFDGTVWTTTTEEATTLLFGRIGFLRAFTHRTATAHEQRSSF